jgi:NAD(P)-dependent dehydrogenase (short-subunit alcohol dehydrogenase family)
MTNWTKNNIPDLTGKVIIVTGGNVGLGFEAVKMFAWKNAEVILASRDKQRGEKAKRTILREVPKAKINVMNLDLADLKSIRKFAEDFSKQFQKLDILLNNAGVMWCPYYLTKDGFELQMGVNHLGHFALTGLLLPLLKKTNISRVVTVSSLGHRRAKLDIDKLFFNKENYDQSVAYFNSKLANLLFTYELQRKFEEHNLDIISVAAHPGGSNTNLARHVEKRPWFVLLKPLFLLLAQSAEKGTLPEVRASVAPEVKGGEYYGPKGFNEMGGYPVLVESTPDSHNLADAAKLWEISEKLTGVKYNFNSN